MLTYREMKDARDAEVAARNAKDAERMARIYRPAGESGKARCAGNQRFEIVKKREGSGVSGLRYFRKMWSKLARGKSRADRKMFQRAADRTAKAEVADTATRLRWVKRKRKDVRRRAAAEARELAAL